MVRGDSIYVMVVMQRQFDWLGRSEVDQHLWVPLLKEFQRLHPNVKVSIYNVGEEDVERELRLRTGRGLGPDLILTRGPVANTLLEKGLIAPVPQTPSMARSIAQIDPDMLSRVRIGSKLSALPLWDLVTLACYNRKTMPNPPRTTEELTAQAAAGRTIGLSVDLYGIWWTAGTRNAAEAIAPLLVGEPPATLQARRDAEATIQTWYDWLRQLAGQSRVDLASGPEELTAGLMAGRLDWIPCFSLTLAPLKAGMGDRLGVSALPSGPGGIPSPLNSLQGWAFGLDSSVQQRRNATDLARLSVDPVLQRRFVLESQEVLPVNRFVVTPVASSGVLAALAEARKQFEEATPMFKHPFDLRHLNVMVPRMEALIQQVMVGVITPREGAERSLQFTEEGP